MGILSWFKNLRKSEDTEAIQRAREEYFDTPEEQRLESGDIEGVQADRFVQRWEGGLVGESEGKSADAEERLAEEDER
jgi:hypothetical protein